MNKDKLYANNVFTAKATIKTITQTGYWSTLEYNTAIYKEDGVYKDIIHPERSLIDTPEHKVELVRIMPLYKTEAKSKVVSARKVFKDFEKHDKKFGK